MDKELAALLDQLDAFFEKYRGASVALRNLQWGDLDRLKDAIARLTGEDEYVMENFTRLEDDCSKLAAKHPPVGFDESGDIARALGAISNIRSRAARLSGA